MRNVILYIYIKGGLYRLNYNLFSPIPRVVKGMLQGGPVILPQNFKKKYLFCDFKQYLCQIQVYCLVLSQFIKSLLGGQCVGFTKIFLNYFAYLGLRISETKKKKFSNIFFCLSRLKTKIILLFFFLCSWDFMILVSPWLLD